ncbi:hypothetical protein IAG44_25865 [Streptomyces roseirectus]|uniref:Uncharacterized protein n=1 Tax=Streptomyces roseirectus TaxID=2768066 RepID=A0A7H0II95_9ACTN|nr:hypothetical protein [Streptomyces roseirectus]QNP72511.1 hypothetical protein IAG44_25865 [Streptomyces roseirectus]
MRAETVTAVAATAIALGSLWISRDQARASREHNRRSLRPILRIRRVRDRDTGRTGYYLTNAGLGPAVVTRTVVHWDGRPVGEWKRPAWDLMFADDERVQKFAFRRGDVLVAGETVFLVLYETDDVEQLVRFHDRIKARLVIDVHYESVYGGEGFVASSGGRD